MAYDRENVFAKILRGEIPSEKVYEDAEVFAFRDINPQAPVHVLVIPKGEYVSLEDFSSGARPEAVGRFFAAVAGIASRLGLDATGYRVIVNSGRDGGQEVPHFHVHILGGRPLGRMIAKG